MLEKKFVYLISAPGTPIENEVMEAINGLAKEELLRDFMIKKGKNINEAIENYIYYFNNKRPAAALNYLTLRFNFSIYIFFSHF